MNCSTIALHHYLTDEAEHNRHKIETKDYSFSYLLILIKEYIQIAQDYKIIL